MELSTFELNCITLCIPTRHSFDSLQLYLCAPLHVLRFTSFHTVTKACSVRCFMKRSSGGDLISSRTHPSNEI